MVRSNSFKSQFVFSIIVFFITSMPFAVPGMAQRVLNPEFDKKIDNLISYRVPVLSVEQVIKDSTRGFLFLDAREKDEFDVSHIPGARHIGYDNFDIDIINGVSRNTPILVYCSIGYRSDKIGGKLKKAGFSNVYNLYGSIFEWANQGHRLVDIGGQPTFKLHTYNKKWSKWVDNSRIEKVW